MFADEELASCAGRQLKAVSEDHLWKKATVRPRDEEIGNSANYL